MADPNEPPALRPIPGSARGRGRIVVDLTEMIDRPTRRRAGVFRRALRRETSRLRDPRRIAAILLLSLMFALLVAGLLARGESAGADARAYWAGVRIWLNGGDRVPPDRPVPALRLRALDVAALRALGRAALGRGLVRLARSHDPAAAVDDPLGLSAAAPDDGGHRRDPGVPVRRQPRHGQHQPAADADVVGRPVHRSAPRWPVVGPGDLDEMAASRLLVRPRAAHPAVGARLAGGLDRAQRHHAAAHDRPAPGPVRVRGAAGPAGLPGLPVGVRPVALSPAGPIRLPAGRRPGVAGLATSPRGSAGRHRCDGDRD